MSGTEEEAETAPSDVPVPTEDPAPARPGLHPAGAAPRPA